MDKHPPARQNGAMSGGAQDGAANRRPGVAILPFIVAGAFFMDMLDGTVVLTALPQIAASFGTTPQNLGLGITAYLVSLAVFIPTSAWAAERFGARPVFVGAIGLFTLASVACGLSTSLEAFIAARVVQGFAAALMAPVGRLVVLRTTEKKDLVRAIAILVWPALIAPVIAPPLGGLITTYWSWHWIFFLNVPIGLLGMALAARFTPNHKGAGRIPFDLAGFLLTGAAMATLVFGLDLLGRIEVNLAAGASLTLGSLVLGVLAWRRLSRAPQPMLDLGPLREPMFRISSATAGFIVRVVISGTPFLVPLLFQLGFGMTPLEAGTTLLVYMSGNLGMKTITTPMLRWFGFRQTLVGSSLVSAAALAVCAFFMPGTSDAVIYAVLFIAGASRSMGMTAINTIAFAEIAPEQRPSASALNALTQQLAFTLGIAVAALALNLALALWPAAGLGLPHFRAAFLFLAALSLVSAAWFLGLNRNAGAEVSGHRPA